MSDDLGLDLSKFQVGTEETPEKILVNLLDKENVEMKTEIQRPMKLAQLKTVENLLKLSKMKKSAESIKVFVSFYLVYMVSHDRLSRKEIISALQSLRSQERDMVDRLTAKPTEE